MSVPPAPQNFTKPKRKKNSAFSRIKGVKVSRELASLVIGYAFKLRLDARQNKTFSGTTSNSLTSSSTFKLIKTVKEASRGRFKLV